MRSSRIHRLALSAAAVVLAAALVGGCGRTQVRSPAASSGELPDQEVSDFVLTETDQGTPAWTLFARNAATYSARNIIVARGVRVDFFDHEGKGTSTLTAREGEVHQSTRDMTARGGVVLKSAEGTRMSTQEVRFLNREQRIVSPVEQMVRVERAGDVLTGYGFESDPDLKRFEFKRRVQAVVHTRSGGDVLERKGDAPAGPAGGPPGRKGGAR